MSFQLNFRHWLDRKLSFRQFSVNKWQKYRQNVDIFVPFYCHELGKISKRLGKCNEHHEKKDFGTFEFQMNFQYCNVPGSDLKLTMRWSCCCWYVWKRVFSWWELYCWQRYTWYGDYLEITSTIRIKTEESYVWYHFCALNNTRRISMKHINFHWRIWFNISCTNF